MTAKTKKTIAAKARRLLKARKEASNAYQRADLLLAEMREAGLKPGEPIPINAAGDRVVLEDNFSEKDKVFRSHGIARYELKLLEA